MQDEVKEAMERLRGPLEHRTDEAWKQWAKDNRTLADAYLAEHTPEREAEREAERDYLMRLLQGGLYDGKASSLMIGSSNARRLLAYLEAS